MRGVVDVAGGAAGLHPDGPRRRVDADPAHRRQVDHQAVVDATEPGAVVAAAADGDGQAVLAPEVHRRDDVGDVGAAGDQPRPEVDHAVVERARRVEAGIAGGEHVAAQGRPEGRRKVFVKHGAVSG